MLIRKTTEPYHDEIEIINKIKTLDFAKKLQAITVIDTLYMVQMNDENKN